MDDSKSAYFESAARRHAVSTLLYRVDSVVHVEDKDDIEFWSRLISKYRPGRYKFLRATTNESGSSTTGCTQCLKYRNYLSQKFFICIDSDLRYMLDEDISAQNGILQTYTYSWENHYAYAERLQEAFEEVTGRDTDFDFVSFLHDYSRILYLPFLLMLYQERNGLTDFTRDMFKTLISLQYRKGDELENGRAFLNRLDSAVTQLAGSVAESCDFNLEDEMARYAQKGLTQDNVYLYVRGHCLYNSLVSIGKKLCGGSGVDFEQNILKSSLAFESYDAILRIKADIAILKTIRMKY
ncbi:MAG: DUF4435 domain-containing protein [Staphylococcus sp.]|nr:DUF4435 domain-containing protein [Staphylococcus sp.]